MQFRISEWRSDGFIRILTPINDVIRVGDLGCWDPHGIFMAMEILKMPTIAVKLGEASCDIAVRWLQLPCSQVEDDVAMTFRAMVIPGSNREEI